MNAQWLKVKQKASCMIQILVRLLLFPTCLEQNVLWMRAQKSPAFQTTLSEPYSFPYLITGPPPWKR